ncbi:hypothetical protein FKM82_016529, partial [Ascaphus truei]
VVPSTLLFSAGLLGNLVALFILLQHKLHVKSKKTSVFYILVTGLTLINLTGKCLVSPMVLAAYSNNQTLVGLADNRSLCHIFGFAMTFFGLAPMLILLAMAFDCWLALGHPFFYHVHITRKVGLLVPFGVYEQYCPGTWCFIRMTMEEPSPGVLAYSVLYGTVMGLFVVAIIIFNIAIMKNLYQMYQSQHQKCYMVTNITKNHEEAKQVGMEELDHLILLAVMTILFAVCSFPLT